MRGAVYNGKENVTIEELPEPICGDNDIIVRNLYASICGTDVAVYKHGPGTGHRIDVGGEFGHEVVSKVIEVGKNIWEVKVGDIVYPYPRFAKDDTKRAGTIGGFSEKILIPNCRLNHSVYLLDENFPVMLGALIEPFTVGTRAARRSEPKKDENAIVFGAGTIGIAAAVALKHIFGCGKVMLVDRSDFRLQIAKRLGFETCNSEHDIAESTKTYFGEAPSLAGATANIDIYIDAAGPQQILDTFMNLGKIGSRFVAVAVNNAMRPVDILHLTYAQKSIIGSGGYMPEDVLDVIRIFESGVCDIGSIITHRFSLEEIDTAIRTAADTNNSLNVIIDYIGEEHV